MAQGSRAAARGRGAPGSQNGPAALERAAPSREPHSHTRAHAAERQAVASPGRLQHVSSTRAWRDSSSLRELVARRAPSARRAMCIGAVKPPPRSRGPVLFISNGGEPNSNSSGASSQVCLHEMGMEVSVQARQVGRAVVTTVSFLRWSRARSPRRGELPSSTCTPRTRSSSVSRLSARLLVSIFVIKGGGGRGREEPAIEFPQAGSIGSSLIESCLCSSPASTLSDARAASARRLTLFRTALPRTFFCTTCDKGRKG